MPCEVEVWDDYLDCVIRVNGHPCGDPASFRAFDLLDGSSAILACEDDLASAVKLLKDRFGIETVVVDQYVEAAG